jgi:hypothetical protein
MSETETSTESGTESDAGAFSDAGGFLYSDGSDVEGKRKVSSGALLKPDTKVFAAAASAASAPAPAAKRKGGRSRKQQKAKAEQRAEQKAEWNCKMCMFTNKADVNACEMCTAPKPEDDDARAERLKSEEEEKKEQGKKDEITKNQDMKVAFEKKLKSIAHLGEEEIFHEVVQAVDRFNPAATDEFKQWCGYYGQCSEQSIEPKGREYCNYLNMTFGFDFVLEFIVHLLCLITQEPKQCLIVTFFNLSPQLEWLLGGGDLEAEIECTIVVDFGEAFEKDSTVMLKHDYHWLRFYDLQKKDKLLKIWPWFKITLFEVLPTSMGQQSFGFTCSGQKFVIDVKFSQAVNRIFQRRVTDGAGQEAKPPPPAKA